MQGVGADRMEEISGSQLGAAEAIEVQDAEFNVRAEAELSQPVGKL